MPVQDHVVHLENGHLAADTPASEVQAMVGRALAHGDRGIVVHFHGGLVNYASGMSTAEALYREYLEAGAYPIFFVWESGLIETITNNLDDIRQEKLFKLLWKRLANIVLRKMGQSGAQRSAGELPPVDDAAVQAAIDGATEAEELQPLLDTEPEIDRTVTELTDFERLALETELEMDPELTIAIEEVSNGLRTPAEVAADLSSRSATVQGSTTTLMDPRALDLLVDRPDPAARGLISTARMIKAAVAVAAHVISRFVRDRDHGFHATLVEEILRELYLANVGQLVWSQMKKDTADSFGDDQATHGGTAFLTALRDAIGSNPPPRITLVGHSAGAVYISEFLEKAASLLPASAKFGIVFEAPASTFEKTSATLRRHASMIDGFRMFTMDDGREQGDRLVPVLYPHSLLYFISGVVEAGEDTPIMGMERYYDAARYPDGSFPQITEARDFVGAQGDRAAWSVTSPGAPPGRQTTAVKHGDFDDEDPATLASVREIIRQGF